MDLVQQRIRLEIDFKATNQSIKVQHMYPVQRFATTAMIKKLSHLAAERLTLTDRNGADKNRHSCWYNKKSVPNAKVGVQKPINLEIESEGFTQRINCENQQHHRWEKDCDHLEEHSMSFCLNHYYNVSNLN